jgi:hypothetical protein
MIRFSIVDAISPAHAKKKAAMLLMPPVAPTTPAS